MGDYDDWSDGQLDLDLEKIETEANNLPIGDQLVFHDANVTSEPVSWGDWDWSYGAGDNNFGKCEHEWVEVALLVGVVFDCKKCGAKKEYQ